MSMVSLIFALKILVEEMIVVLVLDKVVIVEVVVIVSSKSFKLASVASEAVEAVEAVVVEAEAVWRLFGLIVVVESKGGKLVIELVV
jgi:hypothetical protein